MVLTHVRISPVAGLLSSCLILQLVHVQADPGLVLPQERTTGLGCIPSGRTVIYKCTVTDPSNSALGSTVWSGSAFRCPTKSNRIMLAHSHFSETAECGGLQVEALTAAGNNYVSQLNLTATTELNIKNISCSLSGLTLVGSDILLIGVFPPHPGPLMITFSFKSFFDVSWSPPSDPSEGGVVGYMFSVLGEGCGCMNMSVTGDITCVTCSGWIAAGQTCSFEVRTLSQDCGFISDPIKEQLIMTATCDPAKLVGQTSTSTNSSGIITISNGVIVYNGVIPGSTAYMRCDREYMPSDESKNRICMSNGSWSGMAQTCVSMTSLPRLEFIVIIVLIMVFFVAGLITGCCNTRRKFNDGIYILMSILTLGGLPIGKKCRKIWCTDASQFKPEFKLFRSTDAVVYEGVAYFRHFTARKIFKYDLNANQKWTELPECPVYKAALVMLPVSHGNAMQEFRLHTVGGSKQKSELVSKLHCLSANQQIWEESPFPEMKEARVQVTAIYDKKHKRLIVAGGRKMAQVSNVVEVLSLTSVPMQWSVAAKLPKAVFGASSCITGDFLYILGGFTYTSANPGDKISLKCAYKGLLSQLSTDQGEAFQQISDLPLVHSTCATLCNRIFAIGGSDYNPQTESLVSSKCVYEYNNEDRSWKEFNPPLTMERSDCFAVSFEPLKSHIMIVGGFKSKAGNICASLVETLELNTSPTI